jgi:Tfp pilus assembly protein PilF
VRWFKRALLAPRYESYAFPHFNLGVFMKRGDDFSKRAALRVGARAEADFTEAASRSDECRQPELKF